MECSLWTSANSSFDEWHQRQSIHCSFYFAWIFTVTHISFKFIITGIYIDLDSSDRITQGILFDWLTSIGLCINLVHQFSHQNPFLRRHRTLKNWKTWNTSWLRLRHRIFVVLWRKNCRNWWPIDGLFVADDNNVMNEGCLKRKEIFREITVILYGCIIYCLRLVHDTPCMG